MKRLFIGYFLFLTLFSCQKAENYLLEENLPSTAKAIPRQLVALHKPDHIIFVWFENKGFSQIVGSTSAPFINSLIPQGTLFTNAHALGHPSYPEYIRFFCGTRAGITTNDCIDGTVLSNENLYTSLHAVGRTFAWYSEDLPQEGSEICQSGYYVEKHNPTTIFSNVPTTVNKPFTAFPTTPAGWEQMENVVCISPNLMNDMHDGTILQGDQWLERNFTGLINWCKTHNSIFFVYFDEDNWTTSNLIPVIAVGQKVRTNYQSPFYYDHYSFTRTVLSMYGAPFFANTLSRTDIYDCWRR